MKRRFPRWHFYGCFKISARVVEPFNLRVGSYRLHLFTLARQLLARRARLVNFTFVTPIPADTSRFGPVEPAAPRHPGQPRGGPGFRARRALGPAAPPHLPAPSRGSGSFATSAQQAPHRALLAAAPCGSDCQPNARRLTRTVRPGGGEGRAGGWIFNRHVQDPARKGCGDAASCKSFSSPRAHKQRAGR